MGIDIKNGSINTVKGWGANLSNNVRKAARDVANLTANDMKQADLTTLKAAINNFDKLRELAKRLNVDIYGNKLVITFTALKEPNTK